MLMQIQVLRQYLACDPLVYRPKGTTASLQLTLTDSRKLLPSGCGAGLRSLDTKTMTPGLCGLPSVVKKLFPQFVGMGPVTLAP